MSKFIKRRQEVGIAKEGTRGTGLAPTYWMPKTVFTFDNKITQARTGESFGSIAEVLTAYVTQKWAEGNLEGELRDKSLGLLLYNVFGAVSSAVFSGAYKHTYTLQEDNQHQSLAVGYKDPIGNLMFALAMINSFTINMSLGEIITFAANIISKASDDWAVLTPSYAYETRFTSKHFCVSVADAVGDLGDASNKIALKDFTITVEKNVESDFINCSLEPEDNLNKQISISGSMTLNYEDRTWRDRMMDGNVKAMRIQIINTDRAIGTTNPTFLIDFAKVIFDTWEPVGDLDDIAQQSINFTAYYDLNNSKLWNDCYVINEVASY